VQEYRAERAMEALRKIIVHKAKVFRNGKLIEIPARKLVPGDVVFLQEGDRVPADARLIEAVNLKVDESILTGESMPIMKHIDIIHDVILSERKNMVFTGTLVTYGKGKAIVVETGDSTEIGKISELIVEKEVETPLQIKFTNFAKWFGVFAVLLAGVVFLIGYLKGYDTFTMFLTSVSLAVSSVPEGLPVLITITFAIGTHRMAKKNAIVRKLAAVETLGSVTVICADKTGTMTTNEMTAKEMFVGNKKVEITGIGYDPLGEFLIDGKPTDVEKDEDFKMAFLISTLNNDATLLKQDSWKVIGDPTEAALLVVAAKANFWKEEISKKHIRISEFPFSSDRKMMSTVYEHDKKKIAYVKGAPENIINLSNKIQIDGRVAQMTLKEKSDVLKVLHAMSGDGLRVIALAYKNLEKNERYGHEIERDLIFVGLVGVHDPPRKEMAESIRMCKEAGIEIKMLTGDHKITATAIAKELGLFDQSKNVVTGEELDRLNDNDLFERIDRINIFARVTPRHKLRIVEVLKRKGHVVAVTGDGVNDAPALKEAHVGISMGMKGTEVAKEASQIVLKDDNFATIVHAIEEGRGIYDNIRKFIRYQLTVNLSEIFLIVITSFAGLPLPLLPIQILTLNLISDAPGTAFGMDPKEPDIMKKKPRPPNASILHGMKIFLIAAGCLALVAELSVFVWGLFTGQSLEKIRTMTFSVGILFQLFFAFNCRSESKSFLSSGVLSNKLLFISVVIAAMFYLMTIYLPPLQPVFSTVPLGFYELMLVLLVSSTGLLISPRIFMA
ncbi:MAG: HAD-IC family P-type ATPase, partial [Candidatus Aenigmatarchaeota archaeon]